MNMSNVAILFINDIVNAVVYRQSNKHHMISLFPALNAKLQILSVKRMCEEFHETDTQKGKRSRAENLMSKCKMLFIKACNLS